MQRIIFCRVLIFEYITFVYSSFTILWHLRKNYILQSFDFWVYYLCIRSCSWVKYFYLRGINWVMPARAKEILDSWDKRRNFVPSEGEMEDFPCMQLVDNMEREKSHVFWGQAEQYSGVEDIIFGVTRNV